MLPGRLLGFMTEIGGGLFEGLRVRDAKHRGALGSVTHIGETEPT